jgi:hypothetical protein
MVGRAMTGDADVHRVVIELRRGEGPMSGRFLAEGEAQPQPFCGWLELLALLETVRPPTDPAPNPEEKP